MTLLFEQYDLKDETALLNEIAESILQLSWFEKTGQRSDETESKLEQVLNEVNVQKYEVEWISKEALEEKLNTVSFEGSAAWKALKDLPSIYKEKIQNRDLENVWEILLNDVPEHLFHIIFKKAYELYQSEEEVRHLINQAFYIATLIALAKLADEQVFANKLIDLINTGNVVVGLNEDKIYLL